MSLQLTDFDDVVQEVLLKIWKNLNKFEVSPDRARFRTWLSTIIRNTVIDYIRRKKSYAKRTEQAIEQFNEKAEIISQSDFENVVKKEWEEYITQTALNNIRKHFSGDAISVFEMSLDDKSIDEIASVHDIKYDSVRNLRNRVKKKLIEEIQRLKNDLEF
jgi:RNA polymerase sigma factor (sigma-70 family)